MRTTFALLLFHCLLFTGSSFSQQNNFQTYSIEEGLPQSNVYCILQDRNGYLWLGTDGGGVSRFDGINFKTFNKKKGLAGNVVRCLMEDHRGNLWIGTDEGISMYDGLRFLTINKDDSLKGSTVLALLEDSRNRIWAATDDGGINKITLFDNDSVVIETYSMDEGLGSPAVFDIYEDKSQRLWLATLHEGIIILTFTDDTFNVKILSGGYDIPSNHILCIEEDNEGNLWCGTYDAGAFKITMSDDDSSSVIINKGLSSGAVWDITACNNGEVWMGTGENGIYRIYPLQPGSDSVMFDSYSVEQGLPNNQILSVFEDSEGNIWLGTNGDGLCRFVGDNFAHYSEEEGLSSNKVMGIKQDANGNYWLATDGGGIIKMNFSEGSPSITNYTTEEGLVSNHLTTLAVGKAANDYLWIATIKEGIVRFDGEQFTTFNEDDDLQNNRVQSIMVDSKGIVWCGTANGICKYDGVEFISFSNSKLMISDDGVKAIIEGSNGTLWFGTSGALAKYEGTGFVTTYDEVEGLYDKDVNAITEGPRGNIWIGTNGGGIYQFDVHTEDSIPVQFVLDDSLLSSNTINSLIFQDESNLIVGTDKGFDKITFNESFQIINVKNYDATDGFTGVECNDNAIFRDIQGNIWFGTVKGVTRYNPQAEKINKNPPITHITDLKLFFKEVDWSSRTDSVSAWFNLPLALELPYYENHLTFNFSGISLNNPQKVQYKYMLEGQDVDWSPASKENKVTFSGLSHGEYTLKVIAMNANGVWNPEAATFSFVISPPWYQTTWFYIICIVLLIALVYSYIKFRERKLKIEKKILEDKVEERTREVVQQKEVIEEKSKEITDSINYAKGIQESILPPYSLMSEHLTDAFILFMPKDIVSGDFYWMETVEQNDSTRQVLFAAADCTGHGVPGAFVSMVGANGLNRAVKEYGITEPAKILDQLALLVEDTFSKRKDGMDMALCTIDLHEKSVQYAGANNPLYVVRKKNNPLVVDGDSKEPVMEGENGFDLYEIKADKQPVGAFDDRKNFTNRNFELLEGDAIYVFSDGYADQFGGDKGKKYKYKPFKRMLLSMQDKKMEEQNSILQKTIVEWMEYPDESGDTYEQIDDICVIGVRV